jgi:hypothetical protein
MGWFHPTEAGETLTRTVATPTPALLAYLEHRIGNTEVTMPDSEESEFFRDAAEATERIASVTLTLHAEDGRLIPTEDIGIRDTEVLLALAREAEEEFDADVDFVDVSVEEYGFEDLGSDREALSHSFEPEPWTPDEEPNFPRYQVIVFLEDEEAVP